MNKAQQACSLLVMPTQLRTADRDACTVACVQLLGWCRVSALHTSNTDGSAYDQDYCCVVCPQIDTQDDSLVQTARSCTVDGSSLLVLGNDAGLQVSGTLCRTATST